MHHTLEKLRASIAACWQCRADCQKTLFNHCLEVGGDHVAPEHVKLMTDCIELCQTTADFMTRHSAFHAVVCAACAAVCEACAESCDDIGGEDMNHCADSCRACAELCAEMGAAIHNGAAHHTHGGEAHI